jgi:hypothetical protein
MAPVSTPCCAIHHQNIIALAVSYLHWGEVRGAKKKQQNAIFVACINIFRPVAYIVANTHINMTKTITLAVLALALIGTSSCKKKIIDALAKEGSDGSFTATVNGQSYSAQSVTTLVSGSSFIVKGSEYATDKRLEISISSYDKNKSKYTLDYVLNSGSYVDESGNSKRAREGEVEITLTGDKSATGTFHFKAEDNGLDVTDGKFDIKWN